MTYFTQNFVVGGFGTPAAPVTTLIPPPDERYMPGWETITADGDRRIVSPRLKDLSVAYSFYGIPIPVSFGVRRLWGNIIWAQDLTEKEIITKKGGKGGGPVTKTTDYHYYGNWAVSFGAANITVGARDVLRVWADNNLVYDRRATGKTAVYGLKFRFHPGGDDNLVDPLIEEDLGVGTTPAYRHLMYLVIDDLDLELFGNRMPVLSVELGDATTRVVTKTDYATTPYSINHNCLAVDWERETAYVRADGGSDIGFWEFDLQNGGGRFINLENDPNFVASGASNFGYFQLCTIPWYGKLIGHSSDLVASQSVYLIDALANYVPTYFAETGSSGTFGQTSVGQVANVCVNRLWTALGYETYILVVTLQNDWVVLRVAPPFEAGNTEWAFMPVGSGAYSGTVDWTAVSPGPQRLNECVFYAAKHDEITRLTVSAGGTVNDGSNVVEEVAWRTTVNNNDATAMLYYEPDDALLVCVDNDTEVYKYNSAGDLVDQTNAVQLNMATTKSWWASNTTGGYAAVRCSDAIRAYDIPSMDNIAGSNSATLLGTGFDFISDGRSHSFLAQNLGSNVFSQFWYDKLADERTTLKAFIEAMATLSRYTVSTDFVVDSSVDDLIDGAILEQVTTVRDLLQVLSAVYRFSVVEIDGVLTCIRKPESFTAYDFAIPSTDLALLSGGGGAQAQGGQPTEVFISRRTLESDLPKRIELSYISKALNYVYSTQASQRSAFPVATSNSSSTLKLRIPVIIQDTEAKALVLRMLYQAAWTGSTTYSFRLPWMYQYLVPGDVGTIDAGPATYTVKLRQITYNADMTLSIGAAAYLTDIPITIDADEGVVYDQTIPLDVTPIAIPIDCRLLSVAGDAAKATSGVSATFYYAISPYSAAASWNGAVLETGLSASTLDEVATNKSIPILGVLTTDIAAPDSYHASQNATFQVRIFTSNVALATATYAEMLEGANAALVGSPATGWEVVQFGTVTDDGDGVYTLGTPLFRGRRGTYTETNAAQKGGWFIMLSDVWVDAVTYPIANRNMSYFYKPIGFGQSPLLALTSIHTFTAKSAVPLEPVHLNATWNATDLDINFIRQSRGDETWRDLTDENPLQEDAEAYVLNVYADGSTATVSSAITAFTEDGTTHVKTITIPEATLTSVYGTSTPATVYVGVAQYSGYLAAYGDENRVALTTP